MTESLAPTTTIQEDLVVEGQRRINLIWEITQAVVAISVTWSVIYCEITNVDSQVIIGAFFLIVGTYFQRTNHNLIGGIGRKATEGQDYKGR